MRSAFRRSGWSRWGNIAEGDDKNFWRMGDTGPCGPCSELHYDRGAELIEGEHCIPDHSEHCPRWLEVWNLVFMEFDRAADGTLTPLPFKSSTPAWGWSESPQCVQGVDSNYGTDLFTPIIERLAEYIGHNPETVESERFSYQVVADHSRAMTFLIADGVTPSNEGAGLRAAPDHATGGASRSADGHQGAVPAADLRGRGRPHGRGLSARWPTSVTGSWTRSRPRRRKFARTLEAGTEKLLALIEAAGGNGFDPRRRGVPPARHLWLPDRPHRGDRRGERCSGRPRGVRRGP